MNHCSANRTLLAGALLLLFVWLWAATNLFVHAHVIDSKVITHSHPFSHKTSHTHTEAEINLLAAYACLAYIAAGLALLTAPLARKASRIYQLNHWIYYAFSKTCVCLRAPPVCE